MLHPDGIEVFLRPVGSHGEDVRYDELVLPPKADYEGRYLQCFIPHRDESFEIVVEYLDLFDMHGASTMLVVIVLKPADAMDDVPAYSLGHVAEHAKNMPSDNNVFAAQDGFRMRWLGVNGGVNAQGQPRFVLKDDEYAEDVRPGCIGISFQRGNAEWEDESEAKPQNPVPGTFKRLQGPFGKKIFFEFRPLSQAKFQERREKIAALSEPIRGTHAHPTTPLLNTNGFLNFAGQASPTDATRRRKKKKKKQPRMCNCKESRDQSGGEGDGGGANSGKKPFQSEPKVRYPSYDEEEEEVPAEVCDKCNGHKKPPRDKKLAWRATCGSWMYVPNSAPEEDPPEEEFDYRETEDAPRTPEGSPTHRMIGGVPTPLSGDPPTAKRKRCRPRGSTNQRRRPRSESPTGLQLRRPRHLGEYWSWSAEQWATLSLEDKHHWSHVGRIEETDDGERAARSCNPCASAEQNRMVYTDAAKSIYDPKAMLALSAGLHTSLVCLAAVVG